MAIRDVFKINRKTFLNPSGWIDYESLRNQNLTIKDALSSLFTVPKPGTEETFEQAKKRLGLTEKDVVDGAKRYRRYAITFLVLGLLVFVYSFFILFHYGTLNGWLLGIAVSGLLLAQAFRFDFWSYQMRIRRLGVTFKEWKDDILSDKRTPL